jgi:uncharacterized protein YlxW (UPF0749 family)
MGASLLDAVLAETLDPAYAQAARDHAARAQEQTEGEVARRGARRRRGKVLVTLVMVVAGLLVAVTYDQALTKSEGRDQIRTALVHDIRRASGVSDDLAGQLERLRAKVGATRAKLLTASTVGQETLDELARAEQASAAVPVTGPGLLVTLANAKSSADSDPVGETSEEAAGGRVRDGDLQLVVNALWAAGAEAISINGQRLGPTSAIRFAGEAVLVDFRPVTNPYEISAIGDPETLSSRFLAIPEVGVLASVALALDMPFDFAQEDDLSLPAASTPELRVAHAESQEKSAPASETPGS